MADDITLPGSGSVVETIQQGDGSHRQVISAPEVNAILAELKNINDTLVYALTAIFEKMPRVTGNDQMTVSIEAGSVGIAASQTLATVTSVTSVSGITTLSNMNSVGTKFIFGDNLNLSGVGYIYDNIKVS